ncbi:hypothetical protein PR048_001795, partial [Dryococelus australis]
MGLKLEWMSCRHGEMNVLLPAVCSYYTVASSGSCCCRYTQWCGMAACKQGGPCYVVANLRRDVCDFEEEIIIFVPLPLVRAQGCGMSQGSPAKGQIRNVLVESARIARGAVEPLSLLKASAADAVLFPGGFGAAKNLSDFAVKGAQFDVHPEMRRVLTEFHDKKKPIGLACIAPVLAAKVIPGCSLTLGMSGPEVGDKWPHAGAVDNMRHLGVDIQNK